MFTFILSILLFFIAICENCGAIGVKHSFYTRLRNYCSQACVKAAMEKSEVLSHESQKNNTNNERDSYPDFVNPKQLLDTSVCFELYKFLY